MDKKRKSIEVLQHIYNQLYRDSWGILLSLLLALVCPSLYFSTSKPTISKRDFAAALSFLAFATAAAAKMLYLETINVKLMSKVSYWCNNLIRQQDEKNLAYNLITRGRK